MKKFFTLSSILLASIGTHAQISIGQAEMPYANDELVRTRAVTNPGINYAATGPAHTWNFPNLAVNTGDTVNYQTVASTNFIYAIVYSDLFFNPNRANHAKPGTDIAFSNLLPVQNPYTFRYRSNSTYKTVGFGVELSGIPLPIIFDEHDVIYELPLDYGDASASHSSYHVDIPNVGYYGYQQDRENIVDGWGGITTPGGTWDVLRVKTTLTMRDSVFGFVINRPVQHEYKWLAQGLRVPVLQINTTEVFGFEIVNAIYYYDVPRSIEVIDPLASTLCPGATLDVHFDVTGAFNAGGFFVPANHFTAQLSDAAGSFASPVDIGDVTATTSGTISATIPANTPLGTGYRIRVISTSPDYVGTSNTFDITIGGATVAAISAGGATSLCTGGTVTLTAVGGPGYQWQLDGADLSGEVNATYEAAAAGAYTVVVDNACGTATSNSIEVQLNPLPTQVVDDTDHLICEGASVDISVLDLSGQSPLTYQWFLNDAPIVGATSTTVNASLAGIYTATATNGTTGCAFTTETVTVNIDVIATPSVTADGATSFCEGGAVQLTATDVPPNTYQWTLNGIAITGATGTSINADAAGDYSVVMTNGNGCASQPSATVSVTVNAVPAAPMVSVDGATEFCEGGAVTLSIAEVSGSTYQWYMDGVLIDQATNDSLTALTSGTYTIIATNDLGCASEASATTVVTVNFVPAVPGVISSEPTTFCEGGGTSLIADAIADVNYQWYVDGNLINGAMSGQLTTTTAGSYTVTVSSAAGCTATSDTVEVIVNPLPAAPVIGLSNDSLLVSGVGTWQWYLDGVAIAGANDPWWVPIDDGAYTVQFTDANGCGSISEEWIYLSTGISARGVDQMSLQPNPNTGVFTIELPGAQSDLFEVFDATGQCVRKGRLGAVRTSIDMSSAEQGLYFVRVAHQGTTNVLRMVIAR